MRRLLAALLAIWPLNAAADTAGVFDYYVLSLSWSPNWCALEGDARQSEQCDTRHDHGWILHGLWPQYETGYPEYCQTTARPPSRKMTRDMADIMGTPGLAWHQWNKHGTCSGLEAAAYFDLSRAAYAAVTRPTVLRRLTEPLRIAPHVIEQAFQRDNPEIAADGITITCRQGHIQEARICLTRDLTPRLCGPDTRKDCASGPQLFTPLR